LNARRTALLSLTEWESGDRNIDVVLERRLVTAGLDPRDTALAQNLTYGVLRWKGKLDWVLDQYVKGGLNSLPDRLPRPHTATCGGQRVGRAGKGLRAQGDGRARERGASHHPDVAQAGLP
jgi:hypothetical protein